jgi:protein TonB
MDRRLSLAGSTTLSVAAHAIALVIVAVAIGNKPASSPHGAARTLTKLVYTADPPGGGGPKGGGRETPERARRVELVGPETLAIPAERTPMIAANEAAGSPPPRPIAIHEPEVLAGLRDAIGAVSDLRPVDMDSLGSGSGPGVDGDKGSRIGDGARGLRGSGPGPGSGDDDGVVAGNGVSSPRLIVEVKPNYTAEAMRAQIEGMVELEIVVLANGSVGRIRLVRPLDGKFGLDQEAINAVRQWRFEPGRHLGKAVPVRVAVELSFNLR